MPSFLASVTTTREHQLSTARVYSNNNEFTEYSIDLTLQSYITAKNAQIKAKAAGHNQRIRHQYSRTADTVFWSSFYKLLTIELSLLTVGVFNILWITVFRPVYIVS